MVDLSLIENETAKIKISSWLDGPYDEKTKKEILSLLKKDPHFLNNAFSQDLCFGTGGMRGIMGVGTNRMNIYTIRFATQGLANYLKKCYPNKDLSVVIGYDTRNNSKLFANEAAKVLAGNNIKVFIFDETRPTPLISFACRHKKCSAAIMITASHNPPEYNGYKAYWNDGGQVIPPHDKGIISEVEKIKSPLQVKLVDKLQHPLITFIKDEVDNAYFEKLSSLNPKDDKKELKIIYSNLHGTGITLLPQALKNWGFSNVHLVKKQSSLDGNFPYAHSPNPEEKETLKLGIDQLLKENADIFIATDPDADRVAIVVNHNKKAIILTGNQLAVILLHYLCKTLHENNKLKKNAACIKSIVTTPLFDKIAEKFSVKPFQVLTGFKYISELIRKWEDNSYSYILGAEESYGYLAETFVRDKDAISSSCLFANAAEIAKKQNITLYDMLLDIFREFGIYIEQLHSIHFSDGIKGMDKMKKVMNDLRNSPIIEIGNCQVTSIDDYLTSTHINLEDNAKTTITLPKSDVLAFHLSDNSSLIIRPSGTEPKIKIYISVSNTNPFENIEEGIDLSKERVKALLNSFLEIIK